MKFKFEENDKVLFWPKYQINNHAQIRVSSWYKIRKLHAKFQVEVEEVGGIKYTSGLTFGDWPSHYLFIILP